MPTTVTAFARARLGVGILGEGAEIFELPGPLWRRDVRIVRAAGAEGLPAQAFTRLLRSEGPALTSGLAVW
ncbi:hypothetical protein [Actinoallomurus sp. CA-142502]|uniref:hypothetical protein n=1 Tax=Actinoallomurus sp. CA-142502 TaxID=3239885 RepID=UPI003D8B44B8